MPPAKGGLPQCPVVTTLVVPSISFADWINLSGTEYARNIAEIYVETDRVRIQLEVLVDDPLIFEELIPEGFFSKPLPGPPADKRALYAELIYPFKGKPKSLTFIPPLDGRGLAKASIGFICSHMGVTVVDFRILSQGNILHLDWDDRRYFEFDQKPLWRRIGTGMRTFFYTEPYGVHNEILVRVKDMITWVDFSPSGDEYIEADEFDRVRDQVARFFLNWQNVLIDGKRLKPILEKTAFFESKMLRSRFTQTTEKVRINSAMVGVIITCLTDYIPHEKRLPGFRLPRRDGC
jgi:hypothetical protein